MKCEIEFLPVGSGSRPGDAIIARYGDPQSYELMIIDGGTSESGDSMVEHVRRHFGKDASVSHVVLTHSDADHASGLRNILKELPVKRLWINMPWLHAANARPYFKKKDWTDERLSAAIKSEYELVDEIVNIAIEHRVEINHALQGAGIGPFTVLSPNAYAYARLMPQFDRTPDPDHTALEREKFWIGKPSKIARILEVVVAKTQKWIDETWEKERLKDGGVTSASNESSVVLYGQFDDGGRVLLTGDAGNWALTWAAEYADQYNLPIRDFSFIQIPHHGSRRNVGPTILNRLVGPILPSGTEARFSAFVSAPPEDDTHPRQMVVNAFCRRGAKVAATQGEKTIHYGGFPKREGYRTANTLTLSSTVEDYD